MNKYVYLWNVIPNDSWQNVKSWFEGEYSHANKFSSTTPDYTSLHPTSSRSIPTFSLHYGSTNCLGLRSQWLVCFFPTQELDFSAETILDSIFFQFIYLRDRERGVSHLMGRFPNASKGRAWLKAKARNQVLNPRTLSSLWIWNNDKNRSSSWGQPLTCEAQASREMLCKRQLISKGGQLLLPVWNVLGNLGV